VSQTKPNAPEPTEIAGRYQVVQRLGAGAFGIVYKAKDKILGRMLAIKTIRLEGLAAAGTSLDELLDRFQREAQVSAQLKHPNIVTIYDIGDADGLSYLAMEFIDGVGLEKIIASEGRIPLERAASIGAQVADALDFAHRNSVVHRDIKPANIMIEPGDRVKVTDFGIAKVTTSGAHLTITGSLLGTPSYMSPEQARGSDLDGRSDLFAVGCVFYEMLTGKKAFRGESITGLIFKIITEEPPSIREIDPQIPDAVVRLLAKALAKAPEARYQTGRELADDFLALTRPGATPTIRQAELATSPLAPANPPRGATGIAPTIVATPTTSAAGRTQVAPGTQVAAPTRLTPPPPPIPAPTRKGGAGLFVGLAVVLIGFIGLAAVAGWYFFLRKPPAVAEVVLPPSLPPSLPPATTLPAATEHPQEPPPTVPATAPATTPPTLAAKMTREPTARPPATQPPEKVRPAETPAPAAEGMAFLDEEPPSSGGEAGEHLAQAYRNTQGTNNSTTLGTRSRFATRPKSPQQLIPAEKPAVGVLRHLINAEEAFKRQHGRYGNFREMTNAQTLTLDVPVQPESFDRRAYRFHLTLAEDGFHLVATPKTLGPRPFHGDDSGYILVGVE
jgi:predicted Ser/Thr protein kinase